MSLIASVGLLCDFCGKEQTTYFPTNVMHMKLGMARQRGKEMGWASRRSWDDDGDSLPGAKLRDMCPECCKKYDVKIGRKNHPSRGKSK